MKLVFAKPILCWSIFLAFFISLKFIPLYVGIPLKDPQNLFKGAMPSFGVMCKAICYWIQNRLLYSPAKYQGWTTAWTRVISKFQMVIQNGNCFLYSLYVTFLCADGVLKRLFVRLVKPIYTRLFAWAEHLHWGFCCKLLIIITVRRFITVHTDGPCSAVFVCNRFRAVC